MAVWADGKPLMILRHTLEMRRRSLTAAGGKFERTAKLLIDMKSGVGHLAEKLAPIRLESETTIPMTDETVEEVLQQCELKVSKLQDMSHEDDPNNDARHLVDDDLYEEKLLLKSQSGARIRLSEKEEDGDGESD